MKKFLLIAAASILACGMASAENVSASTVAVQPQSMQISDMQVIKSKSISPNSIMQVCRTADGRLTKRLLRLDNQGVMQVAVSRPAVEMPHSSRASSSVFESFEGGIIPEGWDTYSDETCTDPQPWYITIPSLYQVEGSDGDLAACSDFSWEGTYDDILFTPAVTIEEGYMLSYLGAHDLVWMIDFNYLNMDDFDSFDEYVPSGVLKIWAIDEETGEKTLIKDFFEDVIGLTYTDLFDLYTGNFEPYTFPLDQFVGKTIRIAFENVGSNGNTIFIDKVMVDIPPVECSYTFPTGTLYWGLTRDFRGLSAEVAMVPVYAPTTWVAESNVEDTEFIWDFYNEDSEEDFTTGPELTVTYVPDYSSTYSTNTNLFYPPYLYGMADGYSMGMYQIYDYFQAGGRPDLYDSKTDTFTNFLIHCSNPSTDGFTNISAKSGLPAFGCGTHEDGTTVNDFWSQYFTGADDAESDPQNWAKFKGVMNVYDSPSTPLVIHKAVGFFYGSGVNPDAEFTVKVAMLNGENETVIATASCKGSDVENTLGDSYFVADFVFDAPVVIDKAKGNQFAITWSGFDNAAETLAVMSNYWAPKDGYNHGYAAFDIMKDGTLISDGFLPLEAAINVPGSFGIMLDAEFPWLVASEDEVAIDADEEDAAFVELDSFYDGADLTVTAPDWVEAIVDSRYDEALLVIIPTDTVNAEGTITIEGPGVSASVAVKMTSGISEISADEMSQVVEAYNLQGVKVDANNLSSGIYIFRLANGKARKGMVR